MTLCLVCVVSILSELQSELHGPDELHGLELLWPRSWGLAPYMIGTSKGSAAALSVKWRVHLHLCRLFEKD